MKLDGIIDPLEKAFEAIKKYCKSNPELQKDLISARECALNLQAKIIELYDENERLKKALEVKAKIRRHKVGYLTLEDDTEEIKYCANCWDVENKLVMLKDGNGSTNCPNCKNRVLYDAEKYWSPLQEMM